MQYVVVHHGLLVGLVKTYQIFLSKGTRKYLYEDILTTIHQNVINNSLAVQFLPKEFPISANSVKFNNVYGVGSEISL